MRPSPARRRGSPGRPESKSIRKLNAARPMQSSEKTIASGPPLRRPRPSPPPTPNIAEHQVAEHQRDHAEQGGDDQAGELRRHPNGAGLVDDEHADEHAESAEHRLADQRTGADTGNQKLARTRRSRRGTGPRTRRSSARSPGCPACDRSRDQHQDEAAEHPTMANGIARPRFWATRKYDTTATAVSTASVMPVLVTTSSMVSGRETPVCR